MNKRQRKYAQGTSYTVPSIRLIELESEAPLLAGSVDEMEGDTGENPTEFQGIQDFEIDNNTPITFP